MSANGLDKHKQIAIIRIELSELRKQLKELFDEKNSLEEQLDKLDTEIVNKISKLRELKKSRDDLTNIVKDKKQEKLKFLEEIKSKSNELDSLRKENKKFVDEHKLRGDPRSIKRDIMRIENRIETEVMPFEREEKLMKELKQKKKSYENVKEFIDMLDKENNLLGDSNKLKQMVGSLRKTIEKTASESQVFHEQLMSVGTEVDAMRAKQEELFLKLKELKKQIKPIKQNFKEKLQEFDKLRDEIREEKQKRKEERKLKENEILHKKELAVEEKIKRGKKLTTADLLVFQKGEMGK